MCGTGLLQCVCIAYISSDSCCALVAVLMQQRLEPVHPPLQSWHGRTHGQKLAEGPKGQITWSRRCCVKAALRHASACEH